MQLDVDDSQLAYPADAEVEAGIADAQVGPVQIGFLHLRNAATVNADGSHSPTGGALLRVNLGRVEGWLIGSLGATPLQPGPPPFVQPE